MDSEFGSLDDVLGGLGDVLCCLFNNFESLGDVFCWLGDGFEKLFYEFRNFVGSGGEGSGSME